MIRDQTDSPAHEYAPSLLSGRSVTLLLLMVFFFAAVLRFYKLDQRGLWTYDEAFYANNAAAPILAGRWLASNLNGLKTGQVGLGALVDYLRERGAAPDLAIKPGHTLLLAMGFALFGISDFSALVVSAISGLLVLLLVFLAGRHFYGNVAGLVAATAIAVSGSQVDFSRSAFPQTDTVFFGFLGVCLFLVSLQTTGRRQFALLSFAGLALGFALTMHPSVVLIVGVVLLAEGLRWLGSRSFLTREGWSRILSLSVPMLVPALLIEGAMRLVYGRVSWEGLGVSQPLTFLNWILGPKLDMVQRSFYPTAGELLSYLQIFWELEGPVVCVLVLLGMGVLAARLVTRRRTLDFVTLAGLAVPVVYWSIYSGNRPTTRAIQVAVPFLALLAGVGAAWIVNRLSAGIGSPKGSRVVLAAMLVGMIAWGTWNLSDLLWRTGGYGQATEQAVAYMGDHGGVMTQNQGQLWPLWSFYMGRLVDSVPAQIGKLIDLETRQQGDFVVLHWYRYIEPKDYEDLVAKTASCEPVIRVWNSSATAPVRFYEYGGSQMRKRLLSAYEIYDDMNWILIYDLRQCDGRSTDT